MQWSLIKPAVASLFATLTELPEVNVQWRNKRRAGVVPVRPTAKPGAQLLLHVGTVRDIGGYQNVVNDDGSEAVCMPREFDLEVQCHSFTQDDDYHAVTILERLRSTLRFPWARQALSDAEVALSIVGNIVDLSESAGLVDSRCYSFASLDLQFNGVSNYGNPQPSGTITSVTVNGVAGSDFDGASVKVHKRNFDAGFSNGFAKQG